ncbi:MAG TPA: 4a-hydroxytetrahydrobiopterin dehydratase [Pontiellaceae bacterium]|nr:4a-hydroxytetrahydrobiopterin dehydratase [Pontiellaceae bacterium]
MNALNSQTCEACQANAPQLTAEEINELLKQLQNWKLIEADGEKRLERKFKFDNFAKAIAFTDRVGALAEEQNHHPALLTEWGKVTVTWWTHKIRGLHKNDFIMAAKTDELF